MASKSSKTVVYAALAGNLLVALTKLIAAVLSGSSAMLSEAIHSFVDTGNEALLLYGYRQSEKRPDQRHPLGYGRELYFWSFVVALLLFAIGAGLAIYEGISHITRPEPIANATISYAVLGISALFEGTTWWIALRAFQRAKGDLSYFTAIRRSKDPPLFMVLLEDTAALAGLVIAGMGIFLSQALRMPEIDGVASILIGIVLAAVAILIAKESKDLLIGERAADRTNASIVALARSEPSVEQVNNVMTLHLAPDQIVVALSLEFSDESCTPEIEACVISLEEKIRRSHPETVTVFVKPQTRSGFERARQRLLEAPPP